MSLSYFPILAEMWRSKTMSRMLAGRDNEAIVSYSIVCTLWNIYWHRHHHVSVIIIMGNQIPTPGCLNFMTIVHSSTTTTTTETTVIKFMTGTLERNEQNKIILLIICDVLSLHHCKMDIKLTIFTLDISKNVFFVIWRFLICY